MSEKNIILLLVLLGVIFTCIGKPLAEEAVPRISKEELKERLGTPDLVVIDVRPRQNGSKSERMIPGAVREDVVSSEKWAGKYSKKKIMVIYCA